MPITLNRSCQSIGPEIQISQEQRDMLWEAALWAYLARHPETTREEVKK